MSYCAMANRNCACAKFLSSKTTTAAFVCGFLHTYLCSANSLALEMSKTLTMPELKPQEKTCSLGWKATEQGLSSDTKSYN